MFYKEEKYLFEVKKKLMIFIIKKSNHEDFVDCILAFFGVLHFKYTKTILFCREDFISLSSFNANLIALKLIAGHISAKVL